MGKPSSTPQLAPMSVPTSTIDSGLFQLRHTWMENQMPPKVHATQEVPTAMRHGNRRMLSSLDPGGSPG